MTEDKTNKQGYRQGSFSFFYEADGRTVMSRPRTRYLYMVHVMGQSDVFMINDIGIVSQFYTPCHRSFWMPRPVADKFALKENKLWGGMPVAFVMKYDEDRVNSYLTIEPFVVSSNAGVLIQFERDEWEKK